MMPVEFLDDLTRLKRIPRSGWISYRISKNDIESVASHSYSVAALGLIMSELIRAKKQKVNVEKVLKMALLHDISETLTFDISKAYLRYLGRRGSQLRTQLERKAVSKILSGLQSEQLARSFETTLDEYKVSKSLEAEIVHCADAVDLLLQIIEYERMGYSKATLDPIWKETKSKLLGYRVRLANEWARALGQVRSGHRKVKSRSALARRS